ncbi:hypothetical protein BDV98DRAFT_565725 [Pterulicium gracile]|uniref:SET domain-containing protein n=1 Tax=Pterulicium gracile TaxID=1884261 RepID=A0A5C3QLG5_9AGAR|nr:hypothetical protein BDV98DRAFT_565725 [Pterula gracilis]
MYDWFYLSKCECSSEPPLLPGQDKHWTRHRRMCKIHSKLVVSVPYQALAEHERLDVALLHEAVVEITSNSTDSEATTTEHDPPAKVFLSLLPSPSFQRQVSDICSATKLTPRPTLEAAYSRFANNNFTIHSHLVTYAHGVFPMASRLFNHSCVPNAMPRYVIRQGEPVRMEVVALCEISKGQEVRGYSIKNLMFILHFNWPARRSS